MSDNEKNLRSRVMKELQIQQRQKKAQSITDERTKRFGIFLDSCLSNAGYSRADFANQLNLEPELLDGILEGLLPESEIDDGLLVELALAVKHQPNVLRLILGREIQSDNANKLSEDTHHTT